MLELAPSRPQALVSTYLAHLSRTLALTPSEYVAQAVAYLLEARAAGRRVYVMGNGGSAATAAHFVCDLQKTATVPGMPPLRAHALTDNMSLLTAWANDTAYDRVFAEQIAALVEPGDVVIAISATGNSPNIVAGLHEANRRGARTVSLVGFDGGDAARIAHLTVHIPAHDYGLVEDTHSALGHAITVAVRQAVPDSGSLE